MNSQELVRKLKDAHPYISCAEIGRQVGISRQRVHQILRRPPPQKPAPRK